MTDARDIDYWSDLEMSVDEFNQIANDSQNFISTVVGYVSEKRLQELLLEEHPDVEGIWSPEDQNTDEKGDIGIEYKGGPIRIEVKSLQTRTIQHVDQESTQSTLSGETDPQLEWKAKTHIKGSSDPREVEYEGVQDTTVALNVENPGFDILAVSLFFFDYDWEFAFIRPEDLSRSQKRGWPDEMREKFAVSKPKVTKPPTGDWTEDLFGLMDEIIEDDS